MRLTFFTRPDCCLCDAAWFVVNKVAREHGVPVDRVDITAAGAEEWSDRYGRDIPVVHLDGREIFRHRVDERRLRALLEAKP